MVKQKDNLDIKKELLEKLNLAGDIFAESIIEEALQEAYEYGYSSCERDINEG